MTTRNHSQPTPTIVQPYYHGERPSKTRFTGPTRLTHSKRFGRFCTAAATQSQHVTLRHPFPARNLLLPTRDLDPIQHIVYTLHPSHHPKRNLEPVCRFLPNYAVITNRQTDRQKEHGIRSVPTNRLRLTQRRGLIIITRTIGPIYA